MHLNVLMSIGQKYSHKMNKILDEDIENFTLSKEFKDILDGTVICVTGATGLIGSILVKCLAASVRNLKFILPVRNAEKAKQIFSDLNSVEIVQSDLSGFFDGYHGDIDYIIHCASPTNGRYMQSCPAETFLLPIETTKSICEFSRRNSVKSIVYLSSIEYYGENHNDNLIAEDFIGSIDRLSGRSSYPLGKRAAEYLTVCYAKEYGVPIKIARPTQTFGAGISSSDNRVFAQFARSVRSSMDIILHTNGHSSKPYCYTTDCVMALIYILLRGGNGEAYNIATPDTYISILEMANMLKEKFNAKINVKIELDNDKGYAPETQLNLSPQKLLALGWKPKYNLVQMFDRLIKSL